MSSSNRLNRPRHTTGVGRTTARPRVQNTFQIYANIQPHNNNTIIDVQKLVRRWLIDKYPNLNFPVESMIGNIPFPDMAPGLSFHSVCIAAPSAWAFRLEHPDGQIPGRTWKTEIGLRQGENTFLFGSRVVCSSLSGEDIPVACKCPRVIKDIIRKIGIHDSLPISSNPLEILSVKDLEVLRDALQDGHRTLPVIILSEVDRNQTGCGQLGKYALDANGLSIKLHGLAHVVLLPWDLSYNWTRLVGKAWSVYKGAVRTYFPKLDFAKSDPWKHPSVNIEKIVFWRHENLLAEEAFSSFLVDSIVYFSTVRHQPWREGIFFDEIRSQKAKIEYDALFSKLLSNNDDKVNESMRELKEQFDQEQARLKRKIEELENEAGEYNDDAMQSNRELEAERERNVALSNKIDALLFQLNESRDGQREDSKSYPQSYEELEDWINKEFPESIFLHPRTKRSIAEAEYEDMQKLCQAIQLLAVKYRAMRMNFLEKEEFEQLLNENHFEISAPISRTGAGLEGDTYYPIYRGKKTLIDLHLKHSVARDPKRCLRIYFTWDSKDNLVVIFWLPGHLPIRST